METLKGMRQWVDNKYVGFHPNGGSIKPIHIYGGAARVIYGHTVNTREIKRLSYVADKKGVTPKGNDLQTVIKKLNKITALDDDVRKDDLAELRPLLQRLLNVDKGVYSGVDDGMVSFSTGSKFFITKTAKYEQEGEFIGSIIKRYCKELSEHIHALLEDVNDPISILFIPVEQAEDKIAFPDEELDEVQVFIERGSAFEAFTNSISNAGKCLTKHLKHHANKYSQLRLFNHFCIFVLIRYMTLLEAFYCEGDEIRPFLIDFSNDVKSSVARASVMSYTQVHRAISRFYAWGYAQYLKNNNYTKQSLMEMKPPSFDDKGNTKSGLDEMVRIWSLAKADTQNIQNEDEAMLIFGSTIYDMLALEASSNPVVYLRLIGTHAGIIYPPTNVNINKRFVFTQDILEMIMRSCVEPSEILTADEFKHRLWERFGCIIGGSDYELNKIHANGSVISIDSDSLNNNFDRFAKKLESFGFAEILADGILQIKLGGMAH